METNTAPVTPAQISCPTGLALELKRMGSYFPFRIVWGYVGADGENKVFASYDRRKLNKAIRVGMEIWQVGK